MKYADSCALEELKRFIGDKPADIGENTLIQYFIDKIAKITLPTVDGDDIEQDIQ